MKGRKAGLSGPSSSSFGNQRGNVVSVEDCSVLVGCTKQRDGEEQCLVMTEKKVTVL